MTLLALALLITGCGDDAPGADVGSSRGNDISGLPVSVRVTYPGYGADFETLRYDFDKDERVTWAMRVDLRTDVGGTATDLPPFTLRFKTETERSTKDQVTVRLRVDDVVLGDGQGELTEAESRLAGLLEPMTQVGGTLVLGRDGALVRSTVALPKKLEPGLKIVLASFADGSVLMAPLPAEPVGLGAEWVASNTVALRNTTIDQQTTYTLLSHEDDQFEIFVKATNGIEITGDDGASTGVTKSKRTITGSFDTILGRHETGTASTTMSLRRDEGLTEVDIDAATEVTTTSP